MSTALDAHHIWHPTKERKKPQTSERDWERLKEGGERTGEICGNAKEKVEDKLRKREKERKRAMKLRSWRDDAETGVLYTCTDMAAVRQCCYGVCPDTVTVMSVRQAHCPDIVMSAQTGLLRCLPRQDSLRGVCGQELCRSGSLVALSIDVIRRAFLSATAGEFSKANLHSKQVWVHWTGEAGKQLLWRGEIGLFRARPWRPLPLMTTKRWNS